MPTVTTVKLDSKIFSSRERRQALSSANTKTARVFAEATRRRMVESQPTGRIYEVGRNQGLGFSRRFRRSARGQRPAVDTTNLINAIRLQQFHWNVAEINIAPNRNRRNDARADDYAERLQVFMGRLIMVEPDIRIAQIDHAHRIDNAIKKLI